jgi:hypothetical protein
LQREHSARRATPRATERGKRKPEKAPVESGSRALVLEVDRVRN